MKEDEVLVCSFLAWLNAGRVMYEPEGYSTFPDFSINDTEVGVEARRLNRNYVVPGQKMQGFERAERSILDGLRKVFREVAPSIDGECWYVDLRFKRPMEWDNIRRDVRAKLKDFRGQTLRVDTVFRISDDLTIQLTRAKKDHGAFYFLYLEEDGDVGCNVLAEVERNLRLCVEAKENKVVPPIQQRYGEWWLVLVNRVDRLINLDDYQTFGIDLDPPLVHPFARIYLIDPHDYRRWVRI